MRKLSVILSVLVWALSMSVSAETPLTIVPESQAFNNQPYTFTASGVTVTCDKGAINTLDGQLYFGCNAGCTLTFTTDRVMRALVVNGYIKQEFDAEVSSGDLYYADATEAAVEGTVLAVLDINATTLSIQCVKQMRCYSVDIYFTDNPELDITQGGEDLDFNFSYEPTVPTTMNITFPYMEVKDLAPTLGYDCLSLLFISSTHQLEAAVFAAPDAITSVPVGTYPITDTYLPGTMQASVGGNDYMDIPSYVATDFVYTEGYGMTYNTSYYLVSGTLIVADDANGVLYTLDATSYYGSTIHATCLVSNVPESVMHPTTPTDSLTPTTKSLDHGHIIINRAGARYSILGRAL